VLSSPWSNANGSIITLQAVVSSYMVTVLWKSELVVKLASFVT
jgi:hypothetical protein